MIPADWTPAAGPAIRDTDAAYWAQLDADIAALDLSGALSLARTEPAAVVPLPRPPHRPPPTAAGILIENVLVPAAAAGCAVLLAAAAAVDRLAARIHRR